MNGERAHCCMPFIQIGCFSYCICSLPLIVCTSKSYGVFRFFFFYVDWSIFRFRFSSYSLSLSFSLVFYLLSPPVHNNISKYLKVSFFVHFIIAASPQPFPHRMWSWSNFIAYVRLHMTCLLSFKRWFTTSACID